MENSKIPLLTLPSWKDTSSCSSFNQDVEYVFLFDSDSLGKGIYRQE